MITHYLKVAVRNLLKYKVQSLISIVGLAIGLATFALSSIWLKYEMTYDTHWPDAERIYQVGAWRENELEKFSRNTSFLLAPQLKKDFPEIEASCAIFQIMTQENGIDINLLKADSTYTQLFPITILQGNNQFLYSPNLAGITESGAIRLFGTTDVLGKTISLHLRKEFTICALLKDAEGHSNYPYDVVLSSVDERREWYYNMARTLVKLAPGVDVEAFGEKLKKYEIDFVETGPYGETFTHRGSHPLSIVSLSNLHYTYPVREGAIRLEHIRLFNAVGLVVVLCALINYLILYVIRLYIRRREMTLRRVHGAGEGSLLLMTMTELLLLTGISLFFGMLITELLFQPFKKVAEINEGSGFLYRESTIYMGIVILLSLLLSGIMLLLQQRRSHRESLLPIASSGGIFTFRRVAMGVQLFVSIFVMFCTIILQKQLLQLHNSEDMGANMDVMTTMGWPQWNVEDIDAAMKQLPYLSYYETPELPFDRSSRSSSYNVMYRDEQGEEHNVPYKRFRISYDAYRVFEMQLVAGEAPKEHGISGEVWLNEALAAKLFNKPSDAVGKYVYSGFLGEGLVKRNGSQGFIIRGVFKDIQVSPILPPLPAIYQVGLEAHNISQAGLILKNPIRFVTSDIKDDAVLEDSVNAYFDRVLPGVQKFQGFTPLSMIIEWSLRSERILMKLLGIASGVCIFITLFGIFSMVSLTCERRRKEMAIRKVHGAKIRDIIGLFAKEYGILLLVSAVVAFSVGYVVMKQWLQTYVIQTTISWWIYVAILAAVTLMIVLCVGYRVWKAANENPADVVKSE